MHEPQFTPKKGAYFSLWQFLKRITQNNFGRFVLLISLTSLAVNIGGPFIAVYWLRELKFSYMTYTIMCMINPLASLILMPVWGKFADRYGNLTTIKLCTPFIALLPLAYATSPLILRFMPAMLLPCYVLFELMSGIAWAGFNLCVMNFVYDAVTRDRTALCIAYLNVLGGFGVLVGASLGGYISSFPPLWGISTLIVVMAISGVVRFAVFLLVQPFVHEVREVRKLTVDEMKERLINMTPGKMLRLLDVRT
jgi:MFS family permease